MEDLPEDTIIDLSQPGVVHYIYPTGRKPGLMQAYDQPQEENNK